MHKGAVSTVESIFFLVLYTWDVETPTSFIITIVVYLIKLNMYFLQNIHKHVLKYHKSTLQESLCSQRISTGENIELEINTELNSLFK